MFRECLGIAYADGHPTSAGFHVVLGVARDIQGGTSAEGPSGLIQTWQPSSSSDIARNNRIGSVTP